MSLWKIFLFIVFLCLSTWGAIFITPAKVDITALSAICTIFSVLAGLILAIYALHISSIDSSNDLSTATANAVLWDSKKAVNRLSFFFCLYLVVLCLSLVAIVGQSISVESTQCSILLAYVTRITIFFSILAAGMSFLIPHELKYIQERKIKEVNQKRKSDS